METASNSRYAQSDFQKCSGVVQYGSKWELLGIEPTDTLTMVRAKHVMSGQEVELLRGWATLLGKMSSGTVLLALGAGLL